MQITNNYLLKSLNTILIRELVTKVFDGLENEGTYNNIFATGEAAVLEKSTAEKNRTGAKSFLHQYLHYVKYIKM